MGQIKMHYIGNVAIRYTELTSEPDGQIDGHRWPLIERLQPYSNGIAASKTLYYDEPINLRTEANISPTRSYGRRCCRGRKIDSFVVVVRCNTSSSWQC